MFISINVNKHWHVTKSTLIWAPYSNNKQYTQVIKCILCNSDYFFNIFKMYLNNKLFKINKMIK